MMVLREAVRDLTRSPRFTIAAISVLATGIGLNVAVFAAVRAMLLAPLPYKNPEQLVRIWEANASKGISRSRVSRGNYADWRRTAASFEAIEAFYPPSERIVSIDGGAEVIRVADFTKGFAAMLGVEPLVRHESGRGYLLSYSYWQRRFGGDRNAVDRRMQQDTFLVPILGVMPRGYDFPTGADAWSVMSFGHERGARNLNVVARLKPGVAIEQARAELQAIEANLARSYPTENAGWTVDVEPLRDTLMETAQPLVGLLYAGVSLLTALSMLNVAVLCAVRRAAQFRNVAIRVALGASRARILAQVVLESIVVCSAAGAAAIVIAWLLIRAIAARAPASIPRMVEVAMAPPAIAAAIVLSGAAVIVMVLGAAANRRSSMDHLRLRANVTSGRLRTAFTVGEIAACVCLLTISSHVIREFIALRQAPLGFDSSHVVSARIQMPLMKAGEHVKHYPTRRFARTALDVVAAARELPGVTDAAVAMRPPLGQPSAITTYRVLPGVRAGPIGNSQPVAGPDTRTALLRVVGAGYFGVLRIPILDGRAFNADDRLDDLQIDDFDADRGAGVAIVSETFARREWPGRAAVGHYLEVNDASYRSVEIVGVAADVPDAPEADAAAVLYLPFAQDPLIGFTLLTRTSSDPASLASSLRERLRAFGTDVTAFDVQPLDDVVDAALTSDRFTSRLMGVFGTAAIGFTAVTLYAVLALIVALRERDLAIRLAIGAEPSALLRSVLGHGLKLASAGIVIGLAGALALGRLLQSAVAAVAADPISMGVAVPALMLLTTLAAAYRPARRAAAIDPLQLLRGE